MLELPQVTLVAMGSTNIEGMVEALEKSSREIKFGSIKLVSHVCPRIDRPLLRRNFEYEYIENIESIGQWNRRVIFDLPRFVETSHAILVHPDGYIINPQLWKNEWLQYDFAGSPWPLPQDHYSYRDEEGNLVRVGNSVGLRSKKLMDLIATRPMEYHHENNNEDGQICCWNRKWLESQGCKFMPFEEAIHFGKEHELPENVGLSTFLFHSL